MPHHVLFKSARIAGSLISTCVAFIFPLDFVECDYFCISCHEDSDF